MARTNYSYERRQREIAKQKQKEDKRARKQAAKEAKSSQGDASASPPAEDER